AHCNGPGVEEERRDKKFPTSPIRGEEPAEADDESQIEEEFDGADEAMAPQLLQLAFHQHAAHQRRLQLEALLQRPIAIGPFGLEFVEIHRRYSLAWLCSLALMRLRRVPTLPGVVPSRSAISEWSKPSR